MLLSHLSIHHGDVITLSLWVLSSCAAPAPRVRSLSRIGMSCPYLTTPAAGSTVGHPQPPGGVAGGHSFLVLHGGYPEDDGDVGALLFEVRALVPEGLLWVGDVRGVDICLHYSEFVP